MCSDWAVWIRTACGAIGLDRSTLPCKSRRTNQAAVAKRIREIFEFEPSRRHRSEPDDEWASHGYRRVLAHLGRECWGINIKKVYRILK